MTDPNSSAADTTDFDLALTPLRSINQTLQQATSGRFRIANPRGAHAVACGLTGEITVEIDGSVGYYCAGMHQNGTVRVQGNAGTGLAENMMSGEVRVSGSATMSAGATAHGGLLVIGANAGARCGISLKGADIVVGGDVGHMSAFMAQSGTLVVLGDAAEDLGDSIYEAEIFVQGAVASLGTDCEEKELRPQDVDRLAGLLTAAGFADDPAGLRRFGSARRLYNFAVDDVAAEAAARRAAS